MAGERDVRNRDPLRSSGASRAGAAPVAVRDSVPVEALRRLDGRSVREACRTVECATHGAICSHSRARRRPTRRVGRRGVTPPSSPNPHPALNRSGPRRSQPALGATSRSCRCAMALPSPRWFRCTTLGQLSIVSACDGPTPGPRIEGGLSVNRALSVSLRRQIGVFNRVRPRPVGGQSAYRAAANVSTGTESRNNHRGDIRPPFRTCDDGARCLR